MASADAEGIRGRSLRLLCLNMQVGVHSERYAHYLTQAWRHFLPTQRARLNLQRIAALASGYDSSRCKRLTPAACAPRSSTRCNIWPNTRDSATGMRR